MRNCLRGSNYYEKTIRIDEREDKENLEILRNFEEREKLSENLKAKNAMEFDDNANEMAY